MKASTTIRITYDRGLSTYGFSARHSWKISRTYVLPMIEAYPPMIDYAGDRLLRLSEYSPMIEAYPPIDSYPTTHGRILTTLQTPQWQPTPELPFLLYSSLDPSSVYRTTKYTLRYPDILHSSIKIGVRWAWLLLMGSFFCTIRAQSPCTQPAKYDCTGP